MNMSRHRQNQTCYEYAHHQVPCVQSMLSGLYAKREPNPLSSYLPTGTQPRPELGLVAVLAEQALAAAKHAVCAYRAAQAVADLPIQAGTHHAVAVAERAQGFQAQFQAVLDKAALSAQRRDDIGSGTYRIGLSRSQVRFKAPQRVAFATERAGGV